MSTSDETWTIGGLLAWTTDFLGRHGAENPRLDAEVLLAFARGCRRIDLYVAFDEVPSDKTRSAFRELVRSRAAGMPVAYLVGTKEFYSLEFEITPDVLIPRPETELLVVALLDQVRQREAGGFGRGFNDETVPSPQSAAPLKIADVGTGSGILAVCAAKYVPEARVTAIDISPAALAVARRNAERHGVGGRIEFVESNLFERLPAGARFDCILSNPPYVATGEMESLPADVREHEPRIALEAGELGTAVIEPLIAQAGERLNQGGLLIIEVSPMIAERVEHLIREDGQFEPQATIRDAAGHPRIVQAIKR
jgi:release factor glutamine methyltransferase